MYGAIAFTVEDIMADRATEFKCKLYGIKYTKDKLVETSVREKGNRYTTSMKTIEKILNGKPIVDIKVFQGIQIIRSDR